MHPKDVRSATRSASPDRGAISVSYTHLDVYKRQAPLIDELSVAVECKLKDYNPETCILRGEIVNVSVDERVLDQNGKVDASKVIPRCV